MVECEKKHGFMYLIKDGLSCISQILSSSIFLPISEGAEMVMENIEKKVIEIEKRVLRKISSLLIILFGGMFLALSLFFFLTEILRWSNALAFFSIGITIFVIGLILKVSGYDK